MPRAITLISSFVILGMLVSVGWPWLVLLLRQRFPTPAVTAARRSLVLSGFVAMVAILKACGVSLAHHPTNMLLLASAAACGSVLAVLLMQLRPRWLGIPFGLYALLPWGVLTLFLLLWLGLHDSTAPTLKMADGSYCKASVSAAFAPEDTDVEVITYARYLFVDIQQSEHRYPDLYPLRLAPGETYPGQLVLAKCLRPTH